MPENEEAMTTGPEPAGPEPELTTEELGSEHFYKVRGECGNCSKIINVEIPRETGVEHVLKTGESCVCPVCGVKKVRPVTGMEAMHDSVEAPVVRWVAPRDLKAEIAAWVEKYEVWLKENPLPDDVCMSMAFMQGDAPSTPRFLRDVPGL